MVDAAMVDGASAILGALAAGASAGLTEAAKQGVIDLRDKLKARFKGNDEATSDLNVFARRPTPENAESLAYHIKSHDLDRDEQIVAAACEILQSARATAVGPGSVSALSITQNVHDHGVGFIGGSHTHARGRRGEHPHN